MEKKNQEKFADVLHDLLSNIKENNNFYKVTKIMQSHEMQLLLDAYKEKAENNDKYDLDNEDVILLKNILDATNSIYNYSGENTGLTDSEYDLLLEFYKDITKDESIITEPIPSNENIVQHNYPSLRGTLDKIYKITNEDVLKNKSQKSLDDWIRQSEKRYYEATGEKIDLKEYEVMVMPKFDGVSCVFECSKDGELIRALTRGDTTTNEAQDITHIFKGKYKGILNNSDYPYGDKTEIMISNSVLEEYNRTSKKQYKNTRSMVASILNSDERDERADLLTIVSLRYSLLKDGVESHQQLSPDVYNYPYLKCKLKETEKIREFAFNHKIVPYGLRCDGAVIHIIDPKVQKALGRENNKQKYEVAFKYTEETTYTKVKNIEFTTGLFGRINPVVVLEPVKLKGNTVERASLGSYGRFKDLELCKDDVVKVMYDIIPYVTFDEDDMKCERSGKNPIKAPCNCADCGEPLEEVDSGDILYCVNKHCPSREKGRILNYCRKMDISDISYATIEDLYRENYLRRIEDLYTLKDYKKDIYKINGYGKNKVKKILSEIDSHKEVTPSVLFGSIGIDGVSIKTFRNVFLLITIDELLTFSKQKNYAFFTVIPGVKDVTSKKIVNGINDNLELIEFLLEELTIIPEPIEEGNLFTVVFTKVRDDEKEQFIRQCGGGIGDGVTKNTDLVVVPIEGTKSSKVSKAQKYNIPIVTIDKLKDYIKENYKIKN